MGAGPAGYKSLHLSWAKLDISAQEATAQEATTDDDDGVADGECDDDYCCDYFAVVVEDAVVLVQELVFAHLQYGFLERHFRMFSQSRRRCPRS